MDCLNENSPFDLRIYTQPGCMSCKMLLHYAERKQLKIDVVDVSTNPDALAHVKALGYQSVPVAETPSEHWGGARLDKIEALAKVLKLRRAES
ncbi:glutaredoxin domain-containing protein [Dermabacteraceae bacterium CCM 9520]